MEALHDATRAVQEKLVNQLQVQDKRNAKLVTQVQGIVDFYDITRELTKHMSLEEVFVVFREKLRNIIEFKDCQLLKPGADRTHLLNYEFFPLKIEREILGHLAVSGLKSSDQEKFYILFNQLLLILKRVRLYSKIEELSIIDSLTGVFLRRYFMEKFTEEVQRCNKFNLGFIFLMLDLDNFKSYNDRYGHLVGDVLLSAVSGIITENLRQIDIVARYGGEEFAIILPGTNRKEAEFVSLRLCQAIAKKRIRAYDEDLHVTVSIGCSRFPEDAQDAEKLIDTADQALYRAKEAGRNQVVFYEKKI